jgi:uncharacterized protein (TIRG00374 family)
MKKLQLLLLVLGLAFLAYLLWKLGPGELWRQLRVLGWGVVPLVLAEGIANVAHTIGWRFCLGGPRGSISFRLLFRIAMAGYAINFLTPSGSVGGEVTKAALLTSHRRGREAVSSVLVDKLSLALAHLILLALGSAFLVSRVNLPPALWAALLLSGAAVTSGIILFMLLQKHGKLGAVLRWMVARNLGGQILHKAAQDLSKVDETLKVFYQGRRRSLVFATLWHFVGHALGLLQMWFFLLIMKQPASLGAVVTAALLCLWFDFLTFAVPLNLGALEGSRVVALKAIGCGAVTGMAYGVAQRIAQTFWALFGLLNHFLLVHRGPSPKGADVSFDGLHARP